MRFSAKSLFASFRFTLHAVASLGLVVVVGVFYGTFYRPLAADTQRDLHRAEQMKALLRESDVVLSRHGEVEEALREVIATAMEVKGRIPAAPDVGDYLAAIGEVAAEEDLYIQDYRQIAETKHATYSQIDLALKCEGTYAEMCRFMERIEQLPRVARVSQMTLRSGLNRDDYALEMRLVLYHGLQGEATAQANQPEGRRT